jgi:hypothetical protein
LVRTLGGEKGRPVAAPDEALLQPGGAVPQSPQTPEPHTFNGKRKKRTGFGSHPGQRKRQASGGSRRGAAATMQGCSSIAPNTEAAHPGRRKRQTSGGSGRGAAATMQGCSSIAPNTEAAHLQRKTQKSGQVLVRTGEDKTESTEYFKGRMSGVLKLNYAQNLA